MAYTTYWTHFLDHQWGNHQRQQSRQPHNAIATQHSESAFTVWMAFSNLPFWSHISNTGPIPMRLPFMASETLALPSPMIVPPWALLVKSWISLPWSSMAFAFLNPHLNQWPNIVATTPTVLCNQVLPGPTNNPRLALVLQKLQIVIMVINGMLFSWSHPSTPSFNLVEATLYDWPRWALYTRTEHLQLCEHTVCILWGQ